jgi:hypothetical protein
MLAGGSSGEMALPSRETAEGVLRSWPRSGRPARSAARSVPSGCHRSLTRSTGFSRATGRASDGSSQTDLPRGAIPDRVGQPLEASSNSSASTTRTTSFETRTSARRPGSHRRWGRRASAMRPRLSRVCRGGSPLRGVRWQLREWSSGRVGSQAERRRSRTFQAWGCHALPALKAGWATRPLPLRGGAKHARGG